jgi:peptide/nickel transport system permease protein
MGSLGTAAPDPQELVIGRQSARRQLRAFAGELAQSRTFTVGFCLVAFWVLIAIFSRYLVPHDPQASDPTAVLQGPSSTYWFGTDDLGRDVFSRVLAGAASALTVAPTATLLGLLGGTAVGLVSGYFGGIVDEIVMRIVDALLAFPAIIIAVLILAVLGRSTWNTILVIGIVFTPLVARTVRGAVLRIRSTEYVDAARMRGDSALYVMTAEILPNIVPVLVVEATIRLGYAVFTAATLSFLSLGIQQPAPDWGLSIALGRGYMQVAPWVVLFPAAALATLVVAVNLMVDGMRQAGGER